ncbi:GNAT family N-acetyltransferase [Oceanicoccus sagamiensis]|uniref:N-acetyltransferase n=1 Tax=Oceanicoccus sagamiensis TaxID=716816 RepID=A0A1X9N6K5_9GAMM|nr:GNAT family N-acetyltransferase [Oceanicoccus sagamiensis]ARN72881.1 N-acetyltransferase [Oceanicoccus sagamiensis]
MNIRLMTRDDLMGASQVHKEAFRHEKLSFEWLECHLNAFPRFLGFVAEVDRVVVGYIIWAQKSGFRAETVLELEQIALLPEMHGQGMGRQLIYQSLPLVKGELVSQGSVIKHIVVDKKAYYPVETPCKPDWGAEIEAAITNLYTSQMKSLWSPEVC